MNCFSRCVVFIGLLGGLTACTRDPEFDGCNLDNPAFLVKVTAAGGELPADTELRVKYGAGKERYVLGEQPTDLLVIYCTESSLDGGPLAPPDSGVEDASVDDPDAGNLERTDGEGEATSVESLVCELWTQGAATLSVSASGFVPFEKQLTAKQGPCGSETVEVAIPLQRVDGGPQ